MFGKQYKSVVNNPKAIALITAGVSFSLSKTPTLFTTQTTPHKNAAHIAITTAIIAISCQSHFGRLSTYPTS